MGVVTPTTCGMIVVGPVFYPMPVALPNIMVSFSTDTDNSCRWHDKLGASRICLFLRDPAYDRCLVGLNADLAGREHRVYRRAVEVAVLRTLPETHVGMGSGMLHILMGIDAAIGTASLLDRWTHSISR